MFAMQMKYKVRIKLNRPTILFHWSSLLTYYIQHYLNSLNTDGLSIDPENSTMKIGKWRMQIACFYKAFLIICTKMCSLTLSRIDFSPITEKLTHTRNSSTNIDRAQLYKYIHFINAFTSPPPFVCQTKEPSHNLATYRLKFHSRLKRRDVPPAFSPRASRIPTTEAFAKQLALYRVS